MLLVIFKQKFSINKNVISITACGIINKKNRIVGGHETEVNQYPWMAMLMYGTKFYCGATLINDRYVLTAAHCVHGFDKTRISVRLLEHDRNIASETQTITKKVRFWYNFKMVFNQLFF